MPSGPEGVYFRSLVQRALPEQEFVSAASTDDIVFYREVPALELSKVPQLGQAALECYRQFTKSDQFTLHSRLDIADWNP